MRKYKVISMLFMALLIVTACAEEPDTTNEEGTNENETEAEGGDLVVDLASDPVSLDPHAANDGNSLYVMNAMYDTLVALDTDLELQPALAESFEQIEDTVWEAQIREGVTFHDGSELNAEVVKANLDRVMDPDIGSPLAFLYDMIDTVEVTDEYTVEITTAYPFSALPLHLAHPGGHIITLESIEADYEAVENGEEPFTSVNENPVGTGYFKYEDRSHGENITLVKNEDYWGEEAKVDSVTFKVVPEDLTRIAELETGEADINYPVNADDIAQIDGNEGTHVKQSESSNLTYVGMNTEQEPFDDPRIRRAIAMAIDNELIIDGVTDGVALPAEGPLAPTVFGHSDELTPLEYDLDEAKQLLDEAGYGDGFTATIATNDRTTSDIAEVVQAQLSEIGINLEVEMMEKGAYLDRTADGETDMFVGSWGTVTLDADYGLYPMFHSENAGAPGNRSFFSNDEVDDLLEQARQTIDEDERLDLYREAQQIIIDEAPIVPIYHSVLLAGLQDEVDGFYQYPSSFPFLRDVTLEED
ncbi:glutathione ABC transporter substrate-binding protein [Virgibacillus sp. NKC19-3]|uniref:glutathione ABC transporter substrate-binding protein n=1 Tax=Virgibacillus saliphilus TaxID=2831674 RepID=UPI001C9A97EA|nr:glutathione ABC transporter substrate-binding protein [Virgibacillus sp. NKC19-3]MBY7144795.1 glutathione ABC transporter substrate-binding protein [Virgibacillus sp. NKC19-3]